MRGYVGVELQFWCHVEESGMYSPRVLSKRRAAQVLSEFECGMSPCDYGNYYGNYFNLVLLVTIHSRHRTPRGSERGDVGCGAAIGLKFD